MTHQRHGILPDKGHNLHVVGRLLLEQVGLVLVRRPENFRHEDPDGLEGDAEGFSDLRVEGVHELEGSSHFVGGHDVLVVEVRFLVEESDNGHLGSFHVARDAC